MDFMRAVEQFGVAIALLGVFFIPLAWYFIKRDKDREQRLGTRLDEHERDARGARDAHINDLRSVVINNTEAVQELSRTLRDRPCLYEPKEK